MPTRSDVKNKAGAVLNLSCTLTYQNMKSYLDQNPKVAETHTQGGREGEKERER